MQYGLIVLAALILGAGVIELFARASRLADLPLFVADPVIGYRVAPNQSGAVLWRNDWVFNERGLATSRPYAPAEKDILLVGDSIVMGGNRVRQRERLGPLLEARLGTTVWPACAGGWSIRNELAFLAANRDLTTTVKRIVFVLNTQDFRDGAAWGSERTRPTKRPLSHAVFLINRHLRKPVVPRTHGSSGLWQDDMIRFASSHKNKEITFVLYPTRKEAGSLRDRERLAEAESNLADIIPRAKFLRVVDDERWSADLYVDSIHPNVTGNKVLASIIAEQLAHTRHHEIDVRNPVDGCARQTVEAHLQ